MTPANGLTRFVGAAHLDGHLSQELALRATEEAFGLEASGRTRLPARLDVPSGHGFLRVMPAVLDDVMGLKVMTLARDVGTHYVVLLHDVESGALLGIFDADELTRFRTGATTALAARVLLPEPPTDLGLVGSGFEAVGQLRAIAALWPIEHVRVFSPNVDRRTRFADTMAEELGLDVRAVGSSAEAVGGQGAVVLATKSVEPVIAGGDLDPGTVVLSIGSTRPDLRELDRATIARAGTVVADDPAQSLTESGDITDAVTAGILDPARIVALADLLAGRVTVSSGEGDNIVVFKSVGTALQDLAIARAVYRDALAHDYGTNLGTIASLKPFAAT